ncbi:methyl-accepting chemotaxis protein [Halomonas litopenaei]|uniref:methyl-accepting chemotaxis protein n=1 Tax=Halomonas litopenaei TaxID=2109328 RepID=UPI003F9F1AEA
MTTPITERPDARRVRHFQRVDRLLWGPAIAHYVLCLCLALVTDTLGLTLLFGVIAFPPLLLLAWWRPGHAGNAYGKAVLYMALSALLIEQSGGRIEAHFSIFIMLSALILYSNWKVIVAAALTIAVHHLLFSYLQQQGAVQLFVGMEGHGQGLESLLVCLSMHVGAVVAQTIVLGLLAQLVKRLIEDSQAVVRFAELAAQGRLDQTFDATQRARPATASILHMQERVAEALALSQAKGSEVRRHGETLLEGQQQLRVQVGHNVTQVERAAAGAAQLSVATRQGLEEAAEVRQLAQQAAGQAHAGEQEMQALGGAMTQAEADTAGIVELLGSIDQITFQTNLLALNASVEAARAGEHGKGFAVVASEVRQLSALTRDIAQQIRERTRRAGASVEDGAVRTRAASQAMAEVSRTFALVVERMASIDDSSRQQHESIALLEQSVREMQASLTLSARFLDESVATTRGLGDTAEALQGAIQRFQLPVQELADATMSRASTQEGGAGIPAPELAPVS